MINLSKALERIDDITDPELLDIILTIRSQNEEIGEPLLILYSKMRNLYRKAIVKQVKNDDLESFWDQPCDITNFEEKVTVEDLLGLKKQIKGEN